jgi:F-type H+-transporting ATPase subunit b
MLLLLVLAEDSIQLVPDGTMLLHVVMILVMVFVLNATLFKPINKILAARDQRTRGRLSEADQILNNVNEKASDYERGLRQARAEAYALAEAERGTALQERQQKINELRQQLAESTAKEKEQIRQQATAARETLSAESRLIAAEIGSLVLNRPVRSSELN